MTFGRRVLHEYLGLDQYLALIDALLRWNAIESYRLEVEGSDLALLDG